MPPSRLDQVLAIGAKDRPGKPYSNPESDLKALSKWIETWIRESKEVNDRVKSGMRFTVPYKIGQTTPEFKHLFGKVQVEFVKESKSSSTFKLRITVNGGRANYIEHATLQEFVAEEIPQMVKAARKQYDAFINHKNKLPAPDYD